jgi:hypothetical protein
MIKIWQNLKNIHSYFRLSLFDKFCILLKKISFINDFQEELQKSKEKSAFFGVLKYDFQIFFKVLLQ